jgi:putative ABC transport system ATP-binding protein
MLAQYFHSITDEKEAKETLNKVGLADRVNHYPHQLSGGEQLRVCIARALINEPILFFADEPTGNLDKENTIKIMELIKSLQEENNFTVLIVTHNHLVANYAKRILTLEDGKITKDKEN